MLGEVVEATIIFARGLDWRVTSEDGIKVLAVDGWLAEIPEIHDPGEEVRGLAVVKAAGMQSCRKKLAIETIVPKDRNAAQGHGANGHGIEIRARMCGDIKFAAA